MSTACELARMTPNGLQVVFVQNSGDRSRMAPLLSKFYSDPAKVNLLFSKGDLVVVRNEPFFPEKYNQRLQNLKSLVAFDYLCFLYGVTVSFNEIHARPEIDGGYINQSAKEFLFYPERYYYDYDTNSWYMGIRDKNDQWNKEKVKIVKCQYDPKDEPSRAFMEELTREAKDGEYETLKYQIEMHAPVSVHYSKNKNNGRYYLTLGSAHCYGYSSYIDWDIPIPRKDTKKVIFRCNTLQELLSWTVAFLWSL